MTREDCILFSGAAPGAETAFGELAAHYVVDEGNFPLGAHTTPPPGGLRWLNRGGLRIGDESLESASGLMNRRYTEGPTLRKILQTIWYQVNSGQEIYV